MNNIILKERGGVHKKFVPELLAGHLVEREHLLNPRSDRHGFFAVHHFQELMLKLDARPAMQWPTGGRPTNGRPTIRCGDDGPADFQQADA